MREIWKNIEGYENLYQVSIFGRVRKTISKTIIKSWKNDKGYFYVNLSRENIQFKVKIARLVISTFLELRKGLQVNHVNGVKSDNRLENLEWCTAAENRLHALRTGLIKRKISKYVGIRKQKSTGKWVAQIRQNGKTYYLGVFKTDKLAALAWNVAAKRLRGEFAYLNIL